MNRISYNPTRPLARLRPGLSRVATGRTPRYTSYPTADRFSDAFDHHNASQALSARAVGHSAPLSVYVHVPFCSSLCYYCACNKFVTQRYDRAPTYVQTLLDELSLIDQKLQGDRRVTQVHFGGGSPTFLRPTEMQALMDGLQRSFEFTANVECSIEVDPRFVDGDALKGLAKCGFNLMSLGVQDFDPNVQRAINRIQPVQMVERVLGGARALGFTSTNFDLIVGLPHQTPDSFRRTVNTVVAMRPDRIALYNYAHMPSQFKAQRLLDSAALPSTLTKTRIFDVAFERLLNAGYVYIGMDHFALPGDKLAVALQKGCLHRNFQGYTTQPECDLIALGASAISRVGATYSQNKRDLNAYSTAIARGQLPTLRGITLTPDDLVRRAVINAIMCHGYVDKGAVEEAHVIDFDRYFSWELQALSAFRAKGFVALHSDYLEVTESGRRRALQSISAVFDRHLAAEVA